MTSQISSKIGTRIRAKSRRKARPRNTVVSAPRTQRRFVSESARESYLHDKLEYWLYERDDIKRARPFANQLADLIAQQGGPTESVVDCRAMAMVSEALEDWNSAAYYRVREIEMMWYAREIALFEVPRSRAAMLMCFPISTIADTHVLLATELTNCGKVREAVGVLDRAKNLCRLNDVGFKAEHLLLELRSGCKRTRKKKTINSPS